VLFSITWKDVINEGTCNSFISLKQTQKQRYEIGSKILLSNKCGKITNFEEVPYKKQTLRKD